MLKKHSVCSMYLIVLYRPLLQVVVDFDWHFDEFEVRFVYYFSSSNCTSRISHSIEFVCPHFRCCPVISCDVIESFLIECFPNCRSSWTTWWRKRNCPSLKRRNSWWFLVLTPGPLTKKWYTPFYVSMQFNGVQSLNWCLWCGFEQVFLKDLVGKEKKKVREAKQSRKKALEDMSKDLLEGFQNMKFYKFYPTKSEKYPDISEMKVCLPSRGCAWGFAIWGLLKLC